MNISSKVGIGLQYVTKFVFMHINNKVIILFFSKPDELAL